MIVSYGHSGGDSVIWTLIHTHSLIRDRPSGVESNHFPGRKVIVRPGVEMRNKFKALCRDKLSVLRWDMF